MLHKIWEFIKNLISVAFIGVVAYFGLKAFLHKEDKNSEKGRKKASVAETHKRKSKTAKNRIIARKKNRNKLKDKYSKKVIPIIVFVFFLASVVNADYIKLDPDTGDLRNYYNITNYVEYLEMYQDSCISNELDYDDALHNAGLAITAYSNAWELEKAYNKPSVLVTYGVPITFVAVLIDIAVHLFSK